MTQRKPRRGLYVQSINAMNAEVERLGIMSPHADEMRKFIRTELVALAERFFQMRPPGDKSDALAEMMLVIELSVFLGTRFAYIEHVYRKETGRGGRSLMRSSMAIRHWARWCSVGSFRSTMRDVRDGKTTFAYVPGPRMQ